jgi:hypothetical protein
MNWKQWAYGLANAIVSGAANSVAVMVVDPDKFNLTSGAGLAHMSEVAGVGALVGFWMYLKQSPLPALVATTTTTSETTTVSQKPVEAEPK